MKRRVAGILVLLVLGAATVAVALGGGEQASPQSTIDTVQGNSATGDAASGSADAVADALQAAGIHPYTGAPRRIDFDLQNLADQERTLADYRGQVVFLNFWATWCPPCVEEMPSMQRLADEFGNNGLSIVAVNIQENPATVGQFMEDHQLSFEVLLDRQGRAGQAYGVRGLPTTVILGRDGNVLGVKVGFALWDTAEVFEAFRIILENA